MLRSIKYGMYGAVLAGLVAAPVVWNSVDKTVHLVVDGKEQTVSTTDASVGQVLTDHGYRLTAHDIVAPSPRTGLTNGMQVVLRRGRLLHLMVDGTPKNVWTTAPTVSVALAQLGYTSSDFVSVSRSTRLPLHPTEMAIRTPQPVTLIREGHSQRVDTTAATVGQLLAQLGVAVGPHDRLSQAPSSALQAGQTITLDRVGQKTVVRVESIAFHTRKISDSTLASGHTKIKTDGQPGRMRVTYVITYVNGKMTKRQKTATVILADPRSEVLKVGTKRIVNADVQPVSDPSPGSAKAYAKQLLAARGWGEDQYSCLVQMWDRESGWSTSAANPSGAYGIPQALPGDKMASAGPDWQTNAETQVKWGIGYISERYGTPCDAWSFWQAHGYY